jgi:hypothetical protein
MNWYYQSPSGNYWIIYSPLAAAELFIKGEVIRLLNCSEEMLFEHEAHRY